MANESQHVQKLFDFKHLVPHEWIDDQRGLRKVLIEFNYINMDKASEMSECLVEIIDVTNLCDRESEYLSEPIEKWIRMGEATTPIDCYIEILIKQMFVGELSRCCITTKRDDQIQFTLKLKQINLNEYFYELSPKELYDVASRYKEKGVKMYKKYPEFAQNYFNLSAKLLISLKPFDKLNETNNDDEQDANKKIDQELIQSLHDGVYLNVAACLIKQSRYEDALHVLKDVTERSNNEKGIYRRALAHLNLKQYEEAKQQIERLNFKENHEFNSLYKRIVNDMKEYNESYAQMVKKMFG